MTLKPAPHAIPVNTEIARGARHVATGLRCARPNSSSGSSLTRELDTVGRSDQLSLEMLLVEIVTGCAQARSCQLASHRAHLDRDDFRAFKTMQRRVEGQAADRAKERAAAQNLPNALL